MRSLLAALALALALSTAAATGRAQTAAPTPAGGAAAANTAASRAAAQDARTAPRTPGSIKGRVVDESGQPVAGITLWTSGRSTTGIPARVSAASDEAGNFSLDGLEPGLYNFSIQSSQYAVGRDPETGLGGLGPHRVGDFATVRLTRGGVITGAVTDADGEPVIAVTVRAFFVRDLDAPPGQTPLFTSAREFQTDDRGVYRVYGLRPGRYVVSAGGTSQWRAPFPNHYELDAPTYHPSATRDGAVEVVVRSGQESAGVDIRYRGEGGHAVSGTLDGAFGGDDEQGGGGGAQPMLVHAATGTIQGQVYVSGRDGDRSFTFEGVPDGEYELIARRFGRGDADNAASAPLKVNVRGADVTGLRLTLTPSAAVSGTLVMEPLAPAEREGVACTDGRAMFPEEIYVFTRRDDPEAPKGQTRSRLGSQSNSAVPDASGAFTVRGLDPGRYRLQARPGSDDWYVRAISLSRPPSPRRSASTRTTPAPTPPAAHDFLQLAPGQRASGVTVTVAEGAAGLRGRVVSDPAPSAAAPTAAAPNVTPAAANDASSAAAPAVVPAASHAAEGEAARPALPTRLQVHLVPAARERADDQLFFYETAVTPEGSFSLKNVAPGRYLLLARPARETDTGPGPARPTAWDAAARVALRREAETAGTPVELTTCQRVGDYTLRLPPQVKAR